MSGSPKRSQAEIEAERLRLLEEERERQERLAAIERDRVARQYVAGRLKTASADLQAALRTVQASLMEARHSLNSPHLRRYEQRQQELIARADRTTGFEGLSAIEADIRALEADVKGAITRTDSVYPPQSNNESGPEGETAVDIRETQALLELEEAKESARLDPTGHAAVKVRLDKARHALRLGRLAEARTQAKEARKEYRAHAEATKNRRSVETAELHRGRAQYEALRSRIAAAQADSLVSRWASKQLADAEVALSAGNDALSRGDTRAVTSAITAADRILGEALRSASDEEAQETRRRYIVTSIVDVLSKSYNCDAPRLVGSSSEGSVVIRARKPHNVGPSQSVEIRVSRDGSLEYDVDGYDLTISKTANGAEYRACDEAEEEILALHQTLQRNHQIRSAPLRWDGQRPEEQSQPLDGAEPRKRRQSISARRHVLTDK